MLPLITVLICSISSIRSDNAECLRYQVCLMAVRNDYEQCIGGVGAALLCDHEMNITEANRLMRFSKNIADCESDNDVHINQFKVIRQLENDEILRCTTEATDYSEQSISEIRRLACAATPIPYSLRDMAKEVLKQPSECRDLYILQLQRCNFIRDCCDEYIRCVTKAATNSLIYEELHAKSRSLSAEIRRCLEMRNKEYDGRPNDSEQPYFDDRSQQPTSESKPQLSVEQQRRKLEAALIFLSSQTQTQTSQSIITLTTTPTTATTTKSVTTTAVPTTKRHVTWIYPTFPTLLPPLPNYFAILFPPLEPSATLSTTPQSTTKSSVTPKAEFDDDDIADISPVLNSVHSNQSDWESFCNETLSCEQELLKLETQCILKRSINFDQEDMLDALINIKIIENTLDIDSTHRVRRACQNTIKSEVLNQLKESFNQLGTKRMECIQRRIRLQLDSITFSDIIDTEIKMDQCEGNILAESLNGGLDSNTTYSQRQQQQWDSESSWAETLLNIKRCDREIRMVKGRCERLRRCCPPVQTCDELMEGSVQSRNHKFRMHQLLANQQECERKMLAAIDSPSTQSTPSFKIT